MKIKQNGMVILTITIILLVGATITVLSVAQFLAVEHKTSTNVYMTRQAFEAAQAGLDYGLAHLKTNSESISFDGDGHITEPPITQTLTNSSQFTVSFSNPDATDLSIIAVLAAGTSSDSQATRQIQQLVKMVEPAEEFTPQPAPLVGFGDISLSNNASIENNHSSIAIFHSENADVSLGNNSELCYKDPATGETVCADSANEPYSHEQDGMDELVLIIDSANLLSHHFSDTSLADIESMATGDDNIIWHNGNLTISDQQLGTSESPVTVIVDNGTITLGNNVEVYGNIYQINGANSVSMQNDVTIHGELVIQGDISIQNNAKVYGSIISEGNIINSNNFYVEGLIALKGSIQNSNNFEIHGLIMVEGDFSAKNNVGIYGSVIVGGVFEGKNNVHLFYDSDALADLPPIIFEVSGIDDDIKFIKISGGRIDL